MVEGGRVARKEEETRLERERKGREEENEEWK